MCHVPSPRGNFLGYFFFPAGHRLNVFLRRRAPADVSIACFLSCWRNIGHVAVILQAAQTRNSTGLRTTNEHQDASPLQEPHLYLARLNKDLICALRCASQLELAHNCRNKDVPRIDYTSKAINIETHAIQLNIQGPGSGFACARKPAFHNPCIILPS